jgi:glycosyltransferase involved in cell wall biosynthesis
MASIDLLVLFSQHESFGRVLIEAMAMEKPVIASDCGGPGEIVINNQTGILLSTRDVSRLTDAILYLNNNPVIARRMGEAGRKRVEQYFLVKDYVQNHEKLYQEILG